MPHRKVIAEIVEERRADMVKYAGAVSGDEASAEDLVQEAWLRCDQAAQTQPVVKPAHLLWRVLRNLSIDRGRRITRESRTLVGGLAEQLENLPDNQPSAEDMLIAHSELAKIQHVLNGLDARTRRAFEMHRFEGARLREIASNLGISVTTAQGLVVAVMTQIREALREEF